MKVRQTTKKMSYSLKRVTGHLYKISWGKYTIYTSIIKNPVAILDSTLIILRRDGTYSVITATTHGIVVVGGFRRNGNEWSGCDPRYVAAIKEVHHRYPDLFFHP